MKIVASGVFIASGVLLVGYWMAPVRAQQAGTQPTSSHGDAQSLTPAGLYASTQGSLAR